MSIARVDEIVLDDLKGAEITQLLREHLDGMSAITPPASMHVLNIDALRRPEITFWSAWEGGELAGCGALKELDSQHAEIKSMRTAAAHRRKSRSRHDSDGCASVERSRDSRSQKGQGRQ